MKRSKRIAIVIIAVGFICMTVSIFALVSELTASNADAAQISDAPVVATLHETESSKQTGESGTDEQKTVFRKIASGSTSSPYCCAVEGEEAGE